MSQLINFLSLSHCDTDPMDSISYIPFDDHQGGFSEVISNSQDTVPPSTTLDSFPRPNPIPDSLQRVGPGRKKDWVLYTEMYNEEFINWWFETQEGSKKRIRWDSNLTSKVWKEWNQVAHHITGEPKAMCTRCLKVLEHPNRKNNQGHSIGTKSLNRHFNGPHCQMAAGNTLKQPSIQQLMNEKVIILLRKTINISTNLNRLKVYKLYPPSL
jgi:hypothetical protein